jgi:hypothetical protein
LLQAREDRYESAKAANPSRWSGKMRNWQLENAVYLNPERPEARAAMGC